jgi:hypothetical protein
MSDEERIREADALRQRAFAEGNRANRESLHAQAEEIFFSVQNTGLRPDVLEVHYLLKSEALARTKEFLLRHQPQHPNTTLTLTIIAGKGKRSENKQANLRDHLTGYLRDHGFKHMVPESNPGIIFITLLQ